MSNLNSKKPVSTTLVDWRNVKTKSSPVANIGLLRIGFSLASNAFLRLSDMLVVDDLSSLEELNIQTVTAEVNSYQLRSTIIGCS